MAITSASTALHEAGHALCAYLQGVQIKSVRIRPDAVCRVHIPPVLDPCMTLENLRKLGKIHSAGMVTELLIFETFDSEGARDDLLWLEAKFPSEDDRQVLKVETYQLIGSLRNQAVILAFASELLMAGGFGGSEAEQRIKAIDESLESLS